MSTHSAGKSDKTAMEYLRKHCGAIGTNDSTLLSELNLDSLELIECLFELEQEYGKTLSNAELASLKTIEDIVEVFSSSNSNFQEEYDAC